MLEPYDGKLSRTVLRREGGGNTADPADYSPLVNRLKGQVIKISPNSTQFINPMDINANYSEEDNPLSLKADFILSLCELVVGGKEGLLPVEKTVIDRCVHLIYRKYFADPCPENMPILEDLYNALLQQDEKEAHHVATALEIYVKGSLNLFNHRTNVNVNNRIVCYDIKELGKQMKKLGMLIVQDQVWGRVTANRSSGKSTRYYMDEMIKRVHHEMIVNSKFLEVPRSYYQRHLNANRVKRIAAEFDERIANAPKVSYRNGHYYVFDGQHTIAALKLRNNNCDLDILCKVYTGLTEAEEALLFAQQTGISAPLTAGAKLRAKIHGGDPEAIAFLSATQRAGFGLSFNQSHAKWKIACIATAFGEYRQHGERIYTDALRVLAEAWEGDIDSLRSEVLQGVVRFVALYDHEYDPIRLIKQLKRISPLTIYRSGQAMSGPNYQKYMHQILKVYNGSSRSKSLPIKQ